MTRSATAIAHPNIALIKYWGKRDVPLNLPAAGSLSITLDTIATTTNVEFVPQLNQDELMLNGTKATASQTIKVTQTLDRIRALSGSRLCARVQSENNFPTAAGLASSASGFAALVSAAAGALELELTDAKRSELARLGSGSAARSIFGGFAEMQPGEQADGSDAVANPLLGAEQWPLSVVIAITSTAAKTHSSTAGMTRSRDTSPYYQQWVDTTPADIDQARNAVLARDFEQLAEVSEYSCLKMHACMLSSRPGLLYWNGATVSAMHCVRQLRADGVPVFFTIDAGPQLKAVCLPDGADDVAAALAGVDGVDHITRTGLGGPARLLNGR